MNKRRHKWEVWDDYECRIRYFPTLAAAERWAHRHVAATERSSVALCHQCHVVAHVRLDGAGRVWTDVIDCEMA